MAVVKKDKGALSPKKMKTVRKGGDDEEGMRLPTTKTQPIATLASMIVLLFGEKKIGKTTLLSEMEDLLFLMLEPGDRALSLYRLPEKPGSTFTSWPQLMKAIKLLRKPNRYKGVVIDTVDRMVALAEADVLKTFDIDHLSELPFGKGWHELSKRIDTALSLLTGTGLGLYLISHATEREIKMRDGTEYSMITNTLQKRGRDLVEPLVDLWAYYGYEGNRRMLFIQGSDHLSAGHRMKGRFMWQGKPVRVIDMGTSSKEGFDNLVAAFNNKYEPPTTKSTLFDRDKDTDGAAPKKAPKKLKKKVAR